MKHFLPFIALLAASSALSFKVSGEDISASGWRLGSWNFMRKHWLLEDLPVDCAMDWRYGISAFNGPEWLKEKPGDSVTDDYLIDAPGMEVAVGFGADHNPNIGIAGCMIPYGKGEIVFYSLPQLVTSLQPGNYATHPAVAQRLLGNALRPTP